MFRKSLLQTLSRVGALSLLPGFAANANATAQVADSIIGGAQIAGIVSIGTLSALFAANYCRGIAQRIAVACDRRRLQKILGDASSDLLADFILPGAYGGLTQIDLGVLTARGIFCIRTKFCDGTVSGGADEPQWTSVTGKRTQRFLNPLIQNEGRTRALQNVLQDIPVANVVVFRDNVTFATPIAGNVVLLHELGQYIENYSFPDCDATRLDNVWRDLKEAAMTDEKTRKDFLAQLSFS